jgi:hypothetical protein
MLKRKESSDLRLGRLMGLVTLRALILELVALMGHFTRNNTIANTEDTEERGRVEHKINSQE